MVQQHGNFYVRAANAAPLLKVPACVADCNNRRSFQINLSLV